jgi:arabinofuranosyltransferase
MLNTLRNRKLIIPLVLIFIIMLVHISWTGDDAFITMRTVDNFVHGYGLRWNVDERVQVFTHPLWMFLLTAVYSLVRNPYLTLLGLSITVSTITFFLFLTLVPRSNFTLVLGGMTLLFSKAFIDYSTSGLENPATHLMLLGFCIIALSASPIDEKRIFLLSLLAGLLMLNRMDAILFVLPMLAVVLWQNRSRRTLALFIAGMSPFLLWEAFSLIYYGFLFPNAYYAKLLSGVPAGALMTQGLLYFLNSLSWNPITLVIIFTALGLAFAGKEAPERWLALGVCLYLGYIVYIGGDFMSGRFFTAPLVVSAILLIRRVENSTTLEKWAWVTLVFALGWVLAPVKSYDDRFTTLDNSTGISDELFWYYPYTNLRYLSRETTMPNHHWERSGKLLRENGTRVSVEGAIGMLGFFAGPKVHIIDYLALADPFLARLPSANLQDWRIGHFERALPEGYRESLESGENRIRSPALAEYYRQLRLIIGGPIWSAERWRAIWMMNTGQYNDLLAEYRQ